MSGKGNGITSELRLCHLCGVIASGSGVLFSGPAFVLACPEAVRCARGTMTLIPRAHVTTLSDLDPSDMAAVLGGLSRLTASLRAVLATEAIELRPHPRHAAGHPMHLHFHAVPRGSGLIVDATDESAEFIANAMAR